MPLIPADDTRFTNPPSTLIDVIGQVRDAFSVFADATPVLVGKKHLDHGAGSQPRIVFVPDLAGTVGPPREMGNAASVTHSCQIYVRGKESGDDLTRFKDVYRRSDIVIDLVTTAGTGRVEWGGEWGDGSPTDVDAYGAEIVLSFKYRRDVPHFVKRWPDGIPSGGETIDPTIVPKNPGE